MAERDGQRLIMTGDCLYACLQDLQRAAATLQLCELQRLKHWTLACADLLAQVPDPLQRMAWAYALGGRMTQVGIPEELAAGELLRLARETERVR